MKSTNISELKCNIYKDQPIYCLENTGSNCPVQIGLMAMGAGIVFVHTPDRHGIIKNIALSLEDYRGYEAGGTYAGATIGPAAGRLRGGILPIGDSVYALPKNDGENTLHGGPNNLGHTLWEVRNTFHNDNESGIVFFQHLHDGQGGFPGERDISVRYALSCDSTLTIQYTAVTDKTTWLNLTNHAYWNLTGDFSKPADSQILQIQADRVYYNDSEHLPVSCEKVSGTPFDFTTPRSVSDAIQSSPDHAQLRNAWGYNNAYLLRGESPAAILHEPVNGRRITLTTDYPSLVFYSGGYLGNCGRTAEGQKISASCAYALEAQFLPNAPHLQGRSAPYLKPGNKYQKAIAFHFDYL